MTPFFAVEMMEDFSSILKHGSHLLLVMNGCERGQREADESVKCGLLTLGKGTIASLSRHAGFSLSLENPKSFTLLASNELEGWTTVT